jgi:hypothetical protein
MRLQILSGIWRAAVLPGETILHCFTDGCTFYKEEGPRYAIASRNGVIAITERPNDGPSSA